MTEYAVIIERGKEGFGAYVPDLPGCVAAADTRGEVERLIREAIAAHLAFLEQTGEPIPQPSTSATQVSIPAPGR